MKRLAQISVSIILLINLIYSQDITAKLGGTTSNETYDITNSADNVLLRVQGDAGALFLGTFGTGTIPIEGAGVRMMWYPKKSAFRAGEVDDTQWDDANIGDYSTAMGGSTTASGNFSTSMGWETVASAPLSTAMGRGTSAESYASLVIGRYNVGGGNDQSWVDEDAIFEIGIGSGINRANAMTVLKNGKVGIGTISPTELLDVNSNGIRIRTAQTPAASSANGYTGQIVWDVGYIYVCTNGDGPGGGTDTWKRSAMSVW